MVTASLGKRIILTKAMYRKMGKKKASSQVTRGKILPYSSGIIDPKNHVRFQ